MGFSGLGTLVFLQCNYLKTTLFILLLLYYYTILLLLFVIVWLMTPSIFQHTAHNQKCLATPH